MQPTTRVKGIHIPVQHTLRRWKYGSKKNQSKSIGTKSVASVGTDKQMATPRVEIPLGSQVIIFNNDSAGWGYWVRMDAHRARRFVYRYIRRPGTGTLGQGRYPSFFFLQFM